MKMEDLMVVNGQTGGILGKIVYYTVSNILIDKQTMIDLGNSLGLPKVRPAKESKVSAYRCATTDIKGTIESKSALHGTVKVYCRNNEKESADIVSRELVKESLGAKSNQYGKLANILFDKSTDTMYYDNVVYDDDVDAVAYCEKALELYNIYKDCYSTSHVDSVLQAMLEDMQATKLSIKGNLYFVPKVHLDKLEVFEEYVEALAQNNRGSDLILANSMYVVDDAKQRQKMADEFKVQYAKDIAFYKERIQHFLDGDNRSTALCERWVRKIDALKQKKETYESVLKKDLANLEQDFALLQLQARELQIRANKIVVTDPNQISLPNVA